MHSEQTELHLQHMIERAQMGMQGEEKEIEELLFDEVYTLVYTIYKDKEKTQKVVRTILGKYVANFSVRKICNILSQSSADHFGKVCCKSFGQKNSGCP